MADPWVWTEQEKCQLAEAIDMFGVSDVNRLAARVPTKKVQYVVHMMRQLRFQCRKELDSKDMRDPTYVDLNAMDELFVVGDDKPRDVMTKWIDYLESCYENDPYRYDKFKLFSKAFLIMSECTPDVPATDNNNATGIDFKKLYYFLYRIFNNYYISKHHKDENITRYLHDLLLRVLNEIEYTSENEKIAMHNIVSNWTNANKARPQRVYGKAGVKNESGLQDTKLNLKKTEFKVLQQPMIPSFNPFRLKSSTLDNTQS